MSFPISSTGPVPGPSFRGAENPPDDLDTLEAQILEEGSTVILETDRERVRPDRPEHSFVEASPSASAAVGEDGHSEPTGSGANVAHGAAVVPANPPGASILDRLTWISAEVERLRATLTHPEQRTLRDRRRAELLGEWLMARVRDGGKSLDASTVESLARLGDREAWLWSAAMLAADGYVRHAGDAPDEASSWRYDSGAAAREE